MDHRTDVELLHAIQNCTDRAALAGLYERYGKKVYALAYGILRNRTDAEDVLQEVFETVWKKASTFQSALGEPKHWLLRIAHNRSINFLKARARRSPDVFGASGASLENRPLVEILEETVEETPDFDMTEFLQRALSSLAEDQRRLIELAFFKGYSHSEIAENERLPLGTVKTRIRSGIMRLRSELIYLKN